MTIEAMLGRISRNMIRPARSPDTTAAATKSLERMDRAWERRTRAEPAQPVTTSTRITVPSPGGRNAARITSSGRPGRSRKTLVTRESASSMNLPKYAEARPTRMPMKVDAKPTVSPTNRELREPWTVRARTSCPLAVVPSQCSADGSSEAMAVIRDGSPGNSTGASRASAMKTSITAMPVRAFLLVRRPWTKLRLGLRAAGVLPAVLPGCCRIAVVMIGPSSCCARAGRGGRRGCPPGSSPAARRR